MHASVLLLSLTSLAANPQDVLYDFYSTSCGPCQMMMAVVEKLRAEGFPVVTVNVNERQDLASRYGIRLLPTFLLVVGGREVQRVEGWQEESTLRGMLAQIPRRNPPADAQWVDTPPQRPQGRSVPLHLADDSSKPKWDFHLPLPSFPGHKTEVAQIDAVGTNAESHFTQVRSGHDPESASSNSAPAESPVDDLTASGATATEDGAGASSEIAGMLASSVRIRVKNSTDASLGSGVVIDSAPISGRPEGSDPVFRVTVLTCGHILRDATRPDSQIEVDVFSGKRLKNFRRYRAAIMKADLDADVGLLVIKTHSAVPASIVASADEMVRAGDTVVSIGCSNGQLPTVERRRVTTLNRYMGPDTIECTGTPVQGRSGGGLFTSRGRVVGICTNADPREGRGVYASLNPISELIRGAGLDDILSGGHKPDKSALAEASADVPQPTATEDATPPKPEAEPAPTNHRAVAHAAAEPKQTLSEIDAHDLERLVKGSEDMEVICIIRPVNQPKAGSRVVIINRASRKFMAYLTGETNNQVQASTGAQGGPTAEPASNDERNDPPARDRQVTDNAAQTTAAWKPSGPWKPIALSPPTADGSQPDSPFSTVTDEQSQQASLAASSQTADCWHCVHSGR